MRSLAKTLLRLTALLAVPLFMAVQVHAQTVIINDLTDTVTVTQTGTGTTTNITNVVSTVNPSTGVESFSFTISEPTGGFITSAPFSFHGLSEPGSPTFASDSVQINNLAPPPLFVATSASVIFTSDGEGHLFLCSRIFGGCTAPEDGTAQTLGTINWSSGSTNTIKVESDPGVLSATPEPSSLILFGTGLLSLIGAARRKLFG